MSLPIRPRVLIAEDHVLVGEALQSLLAADFDLVGVVQDGRAMVEAATQRFAAPRPAHRPLSVKRSEPDPVL
mgnify:CR=1 FL=1